MTGGSPLFLYIISHNMYICQAQFSPWICYLLYINMSNSNENCIFCKIINKEIPSSIIYEDDKFFCFLDINPVTKGHALLVPKEHHIWMHEVPDELLAESFIITKKLMNSMIKGLGCDYVQILVVGKDVPHFHIHIIPRHLDDKLPQLQNTSYGNDNEKNEIALKIKNAL